MAKRFSSAFFSSVQIRILSGFAACVLCSCSHQQPKTASANRMKNRRASEALHRTLKKQQSVIDELREKNLVLEQRLKTGAPIEAAFATGEPKVSVETSLDAAASTQLPSNLKIETDPSSDQILYGKVLDAYGRHHLADAQKATELLIRAYRDSIHADNALYLTGRLALESVDRPLALKYMNRVLRDYPRGNKAVSALFLRGIIQKQMGQMSGAKQDLTTLARAYPGSPEAQRVRWELKTFAIDASSSKKEL